MANRLVIRYYPVDGDWSSAQDQTGSFGLAIHLSPVLGLYDTHPQTMGVAGSESLYSDLVKSSDSGEYWDGQYATVINFSTYGMVPGDFVEKEVYLLQEDRTTIIPVDDSTLPLDAIVAGLGPGPGVWWGDPAVVGAAEQATASYAGGALEFGIYVDDVYTPSAAVWVRGSFFQPKSDGTSWTGAPIPEATPDSYYFEEYGVSGSQVLKVRLTLGPPSGFWTQFTRSRETIT
uniref:Uncharacterized protein n=1 Tax=viral metagenome TaxID=1070528 RepID=A0A6M3M6U4_9ZZZZ